MHAAAANSQPFVPARQAPPPPPASGSSFKAKDTPTATHPPKTRNSLQKPPPRNRKPSLQVSAQISDPQPANIADLSNLDINPNNTNNMTALSSPPPARPSRNNTATLHDIFDSQLQIPQSPPATVAQRRMSSPVMQPFDPDVFGDHAESVSPPADGMYSSSVGLISVPSLANGSRIRSSTQSKGKKGMLGFMSELLNSNKRIEISTPYDPVHLTHVGFNTSTGEFTGLPKEWQQLLQDSGISRMEQEKNPEAVMEIVKFYQEGGGDVWEKMGSAMGDSVPVIQPQQTPKPSIDDNFFSPVSVFMFYQLLSLSVLSFLALCSTAPEEVTDPNCCVFFL
jgi:p21-activated kinase 1